MYVEVWPMKWRSKILLGDNQGDRKSSMEVSSERYAT